MGGVGLFGGSPAAASQAWSGMRPSLKEEVAVVVEEEPMSSSSEGGGGTLNPKGFELLLPSPANAAQILESTLYSSFI